MGDAWTGSLEIIPNPSLRDSTGYIIRVEVSGIVDDHAELLRGATASLIGAASEEDRKS